MPTACYIHIPFCRSKCNYCSFTSYIKSELISEYINALSKEIDKYYKGENLKTLYFGGGTPSLMPTNLLEILINKFSFADNAEVTLEANPKDCSIEYLSAINSIGINRLSIGSQTFNNKILKIIGRQHTCEDILNSVYNAKSSGFNNISLDLIYGLPEQNIKDLKIDLDNILSLGIQHVSTYGLKIEGGSKWGIKPPNNIPDDDEQAEMYEYIDNMLLKNSYYRYEFSNFAKSGFESRHNLTYWNNNEYYGFGVSAHGYVNGKRYSNYCELNKYLENPLKHEYCRVITQKEKLEEEIFLGFRKTSGIDISDINKKFHINFEKKYKNILSKYSDFIIKTEKGYAFNLKGSMLSNEILPEFID